MKISTRGRYALEALLYMAYAAGNEPVNIGRVCAGTGIPEKYLEQLFFMLRKEGIVSTVRGPRGGYFIARPLDRLTAGEIVRAAEGALLPVPCAGERGTCGFDRADACVTRLIWRRVLQAVESVLDHATLACLAQEYGRMD